MEIVLEGYVQAYLLAIEKLLSVRGEQRKEVLETIAMIDLSIKRAKNEIEENKKPK